MSATPDQPNELTPLKRAFLAIEDLQARLATAEQARREPIAIIGLGCRLPGGAGTPDELWGLLQDGVDAIGDIPADRWDVDAFYDPDVSVPGKMSTRHGGFLRAVDGFEPQLFGIAPREAAAMDPQQRLLLEVAWEALERAGQAPARLAGTRTGVFVGINTNDYAQLTLNTQGLDGLGAYYASGIAHSIASGRLSYILGLAGPSISLDTACSSSLVAVHLAVQSLRSGESTLALAGGVNLMLSPEMSITLSKYQMMAPDGRCKFGDATADGFVRAEGCAVGLRVGQALQHHDGAALGHLEAAAGITGLCKLVVMLEHGRVPASLHFDSPSPHVPWDELPLRIPTGLVEWEPAGGRRLAGLSSFGFSGTNVHVVVEEAPVADPPEMGGGAERPLHVLTLSARTDAALRELSGRFAGRLRGCPPGELADVTHTANTGRSQLQQRLAVVGRDPEEVADRLAAFAGGDEPPGVLHHDAERPDPPRVAFLFTGQGAQYAGMGRGLYETELTFRAALDRGAAILSEHLEVPLLEVLFAEPGSERAALLDQTAYTQPAMVALECALAELWQSWGVTPSAVLGHSVGEYAAATVAGVLSLEDSLGLIAARGRLMQRLPAGGAMAAVFRPRDEVEDALAAHGGAVSVAADNGPAHTVISGPGPDVQALVEQFQDAGARAQRLNVSHAFHSPLVDPMLSELEDAARATALRPPRLRLVSNVTGRRATTELTEPGYWRRHAREAVRFAPGVEHLVQLGCDVFVEIGPHPTLVGMAQAALRADGALWLPSLRKGRDDTEQLLESLAQLSTHGVAIDWQGVDRHQQRRTVTLPTYPFQRDRYWITQGSVPSRHDASGGGHPLLGRHLRSALAPTQFEQELTSENVDFLRDHRVFGTCILPATGYIEIALAAGEASGAATNGIESMEIVSALGIADGEARVVQTVVSTDGGAAEFEIHSQREDETWQLHARGRLTSTTTVPAAADLDRWRESANGTVEAEEHYDMLRERGLGFGPSLFGVERIWRGEREVLGRIGLQAEPGPYRLHPALLDGCLQTVAWLVEDREATYLPIALGRVELHRPPGESVWAHAVLRSGGADAPTMTVDVSVVDDDGGPVATLTGLSFTRAGADALRGLGRGGPADWMYELAWRRDDGPRRTTSLVAPAQVAEALTGPSCERVAEHDLDHYQCLLDDLDRLSADYVLAALSELGARVAPGERVVEADLDAAEPHRRLVVGLLNGLAEDGLLERDGDAWRCTTTAPADMTARWQEMVQRYPEGIGELEVTRRCGESLAAALRGDADPLELLFPGGSTAAAEQMYQRSPFARYYNSLVGDAVAALAAGEASGAGTPGSHLRILEIGAGTGGTTAHVLPRLPVGGADYTFTDISPLFVGRARERFAAHAGVEYRTLDIEADPEVQGFDRHEYDVIIATNVLHATADLRTTFEHVARLLAPGGLLLLLEMTKPHRYIDISFGLTPGWWKFTDTDLRPDSLLLDRDGWMSFLAAAGFGQPAAVPALDSSDRADLRLQTLFVARAPEAAGVAELPPDLRSWLILADEGGVGSSLAELVGSRGGTATLATAAGSYARTAPDRVELDPTDPEQLARLVGEAPPEGWQGVIHLWSLDEPGPSLTATMQARTGSALSLVQALVGSGSAPRLWLVTRGAQGLPGADVDPAQAPLWGFGRVVGVEHPELRCTLVDLDPAPDGDGALALLAELTADGEQQVLRRASSRRLARLVRCPEAASPGGDEQAVRLALPCNGVLDDLHLQPVERTAPGPGEVEIRVHAAGLNFRDVMNALAMRDDQDPPGSECAGVVTAVGADVRDLRAGDAVVAIAPGSFGTFVTASAELVARKPGRLSFDDAATLPLAFLTAHYALHGQARLQPGETVLVHAAAGGVGLAAVQLARRVGAHPLGTAGSPQKRAYLARLGIELVADSRSAAFADEVERHTGGRGADVVLNSLTGELITRSLDVTAPDGRFVELGKREVWSVAEIAERYPGVGYHTVPLADDIVERPADVGRLLRELLAAVEAGELDPLPVQRFDLDDAPAAFRYMAQAHHIGKIVLVDPTAVAAPARTVELARADGSYLITGGLAGLGLVVAEWLTAHGARHLALMARHAPGPDALDAIARIEAPGAQVLVVQGDDSAREDVAAALAAIAANQPPLAGIIHSAGVLDDAALVRQDWRRFATVLDPKVAGARNLHELTLGLPLDHFVLFSSAASLFGSPGQANHAAANSYLDALASHRRSRGLPGLSINWGAWAEIGSVVAHGIEERVRSQGLGVMAPDQGLEALGALMRQGRPDVGVVPIDWSVFLRKIGGAPAWLTEVATGLARPNNASRRRATTVDIRAQLLAVLPAQREQLLLDFVSAQVARVLGEATPGSIGERQPLHELGLDSLMAVELRNLLGAGLGLDQELPATVVFDYPTVEALEGYLAKTVLGGDAANGQGAAPAAGGGSDNGHDDLLASIEAMSDDDVARLIGG